jgi:integrase
MGSVRCRRDTGHLFFDFRFKSVRCREQTTLRDTPENRRKMKKVLDRIEAEIAAGTFEYGRYFGTGHLSTRFHAAAARSVSNGTIGSGGEASSDIPLFADFAEVWYRENEVSWRRSYRTTVRSTLNQHLAPRFGGMRLTEISRAVILAFRADLGEAHGKKKGSRLSNRRINAILMPLRQILAEASDRFCFAMPFARIKPLKVKRSDVDPFTLDEVQRILQQVRADFRAYYTVRFLTGLRTGEIDGLKWKYVDFDRRLILVRETIVYGEEDCTKTESSQRDVQMSQPVYDALRAQEQATRGLSEFVFCNRDGHPLDHNNVTNRVWYPLLRRLGFEPRRPYQTRHTAATLWLAAGESPEWIRSQLGHSTTEMLFRVYSRFVPNLTRKDGSAFERLLNSAFAPAQPEGEAHA